MPATLNVSNYHSFVVDYGAALGSSIQSVAIYANSDPGTTAFSIDNIIAANDFHHNSIFGWEDDCYYCVQAIDGTTVTIDSANTATGGRGWYGTDGTAELFRADPNVFYATLSINAIQDSGSLSAGPITFSGDGIPAQIQGMGLHTYTPEYLAQAILFRQVTQVALLKTLCCLEVVQAL